ncbi:MAG: hypothetical protein A2X48_04100 [Lentisphaerae bacterium GWF2_49_21]|nr:MAG: hypothetical protein A2X48_04100 [Lentisphaerae bacterium GWF2_49_21]
MSEENRQMKFSWIPGIIRHDYLRKLIALCFALLVWWKISIQIGIEEIVRNVPVQIATSEQTVNLDEDIRYVDLTVRGRSQKRLNLLSPNDFKIEIEIGDNEYVPGKPLTVKILKSASITKPFGISITRTSPEIVSIYLDKKAAKEVPVNARFTGMTSEDYACGEVKLIPEKVKITGPESIISPIIRVHTDPIFLDPKTIEDFEYLAKISEAGGKVKVFPPKVTAHVEIYRKFDTRIFSGVPISVLGNPGAGWSVKKIAPAHVEITAGGIKSSLEVMNGSEISPFTDVTSLKEPGVHKVKLQCFVNVPGIKINSISPAEVEIEISDAKK